MSEVLPLTVELTAREVLEASSEAGQQSVPSPSLYMLAMVLVFLASMETGLSLAFISSQRFPMTYMVLAHQFLSLALPALLFLIGLWTVNRLYHRIATNRQDRHRQAQATPISVAATYTVEDAGFRLATPRGEWLAKWISINRLIPTSEGWIVGNDLASLYVPKRAFADESIERAWLNAMLERMSDQARTASAEAQDFMLAVT